MICDKFKRWYEKCGRKKTKIQDYETMKLNHMIVILAQIENGR